MKAVAVVLAVSIAAAALADPAHSIIGRWATSDPIGSQTFAFGAKKSFTFIGANEAMVSTLSGSFVSDGDTIHVRIRRRELKNGDFKRAGAMDEREDFSVNWTDENHIILEKEGHRTFLTRSK